MLDAITAQLARHGMLPRGGFAFAAGEAAPEGPDGAPASAVLLVGQGGGSIWPHFQAWRRAREAIDNPLDTWSRAVIGQVAAQIGARAVSPSDRPFLPFQQWAVRAEGLRPSPLGLLMHPDYGLWHAYRGALLFAGEHGRRLAASLPEPRTLIHLCDACDGKPCMKACPTGAHGEAGFDHAACLAHVRSDAGDGCMTGGCRDRNACPQARQHRYPAAMQVFHMRAFAGG